MQTGLYTLRRVRHPVAARTSLLSPGAMAGLKRPHRMSFGEHGQRQSAAGRPCAAPKRVAAVLALDVGGRAAVSETEMWVHVSSVALVRQEGRGRVSGVAGARTR